MVEEKNKALQVAIHEALQAQRQAESERDEAMREVRVAIMVSRDIEDKAERVIFERDFAKQTSMQVLVCVYQCLQCF